ncbi:response regulator transcription factor [Thermogemmatispora onikobensis]|uniref:response regulator transcription factor n=1 Tax=Thermogemmatispora onikobensis TaxID=732234 RepID=UPI000853C1C7|nr:helix-turn-helix transcriptional regulator [Thermogemmatispora onikobensis]
MGQRQGYHRQWGPREPGPPRPREWEVLLLLRQGLEDEEIARRMGITASTVRGHIYRLRDRLGANTRAELLRRIPWEQCPPELLASLGQTIPDQQQHRAASFSQPGKEQRADREAEDSRSATCATAPIERREPSHSEP